MSAVRIPIQKTDYLRLFSKVKLSREMQTKMEKVQIGQDFCRELEERKIPYAWCIKHPEVLGCSESRDYYQRYQDYLGKDYSICKHLLVHERKGEKRTFFIIVDDSKTVDLIQLKEEIGCSKLEFVSSEEMKELLHTVPGNVSLFNMQFDSDDKVNLIIDRELLDKSLLAFHPLYNGMSLFLTPDSAMKYLETIDKSASFMEIPDKKIEHVLEKVI